MPPHMHPRSRMTASLFTTTLMVSFLVVAAPHLIPCPVDPRTLADGPDPTRTPRPRPARRSDAADDSQEARRKTLEDKLNPRRECPIPKPGGLVGQVLGMTQKDPSVQHTPPQASPQIFRATRSDRDD